MERAYSLGLKLGTNYTTTPLEILMIKINLQLFSILREKLPPESKGRSVMHVDEGTTLQDLLDELGIKRRVVISVNGVQNSDKSHPLNDGDEVKIFSSISGG